MKKFKIYNETSGHVLGVYEGETEEAAIKAMRLDGGVDGDATDKSFPRADGDDREVDDGIRAIEQTED